MQNFCNLQFYRNLMYLANVTGHFKEHTGGNMPLPTVVNLGKRYPQNHDDKEEKQGCIEESKKNQEVKLTAYYCKLIFYIDGKLLRDAYSSSS